MHQTNTNKLTNLLLFVLIIVGNVLWQGRNGKAILKFQMYDEQNDVYGALTRVIEMAIT